MNAPRDIQADETISIPPDIVKVYIDLPNCSDSQLVVGESIWARAIGCDLYEIDNVPFAAYGLNYLDVVRAVPDGPGLYPKVREVIRRSGHQTMRVWFVGDPNGKQARHIETLKALGCEIERGDDEFVCLSVPPETDYKAVLDYLDEQLYGLRRGLLDYETCEARVSGSFDDLPEVAADAHGVMGGDL